MTEVHSRNATSPSGHQDNPAQSSLHTIARGDTLGGLARQHGVSLEALLQGNPQIRNPDLIYAGEQLAIPEGGQRAYTVRSGDTLGAIARDHGSTVEALATANNIRNPDLIQPGDRLLIPAASTPDTAPVPPTRPSPEQPVGTTPPGAPDAPAPEVQAPDATTPPASDTAFDYDDIVGVRGNPHVTPAFIAEVEAMAERLGASPEHLMAVMSFETGGSFDPAQRHAGGLSSATGLIQFLEGTANDLGTTTAELARMSSVEQLAYVERYLSAPHRLPHLGTLEGVYTAVLRGTPTPDPAATLFSSGSEEYRVNSGLDFDRDGRITAGEATQAVASRLYGGVSAVQQQLVDAGVVPAPLQPGFVDGQFGPNTSNAVRSFQEANGLPATGLLDDATSRALFGIGTATPPEQAPAPGGATDLQLSQPVHERGTPHRITVTSPVIGEFILTEGFMARGGPHSSKGEALAIYSDNAGVAERVPAGVYNLGIDYVATDGRIRSWFDGTVEEIRHDPRGYGNYVITRTDTTFNYQGSDYTVYAHYAHAADFNVRAGDSFRAGQDIGTQDSTGSSTGDHVDFLTWINVDGQRIFVSPNLLAGAH